MKSDLTAAERKRLAHLEEVVEQGRAAYKAAADALREIREKRLHRPLTFERYVRVRFSRSYNWSKDLMRWASVLDSLNAGGTDTAVSIEDISQRSARFLATMPAAKRRTVVAKARQIGGADCDLTEQLLRDALSATLRPKRPGRFECELHHARFQDVTPPPGTAALALLDVPYSPDWSDQFPALAEWVFRALRPGGRVLCYCGNSQLPAAMSAFSKQKDLSYVWTLSRLHDKAGGFAFPLGSASKFTPIVCHQKSPVSVLGLMDVVAAGEASGHHHEWEKPVDELARLIELLTEGNDLVVDCVMGSGSTGAACASLAPASRRFFGVEANEVHFKTAAKRLGWRRKKAKAA